MEKVIKKWRDNNKDKLKLQKKREKVRNILRKYNVLPKHGYVLNEEQTKIMEQISNNDFSFYDNFKFEKHKQTITYKKRIHKESERPVLKRSRLLYELRLCGILPQLGEPLNEIQKEIISFVEENYETPIKSFITKHSHLTSPEYSIWYRTKNSVSKHKNRKHSDEHFNIEISDILIPEYCPYLGVKLSTNINDCHSPNYFTIDRIDSSKGYVKGNVQVISRLANTMKNNATEDELIKFAEGILKIHKPRFS